MSEGWPSIEPPPGEPPEVLDPAMRWWLRRLSYQINHMALAVSQLTDVVKALAEEQQKGGRR